jgi:hypothetical protein
MVADRKPKRNASTLMAGRPAGRLGVPRPLRTESRKPAGVNARGVDHMPNGDPPSVMLWGDED